MKKRILIVDDDWQIRESLRKVLQTEGYAVSLASDGRTALEKVDAESIDLLLLDLNLPIKGGWDVFDRVTSLNPLLPVIIITGRERQEEFAGAVGLSALVEKPINVPALLQTIVVLLVEDPQSRLERLTGLRNDLRYTPALPTNGRPRGFRE